MQAHQHQVALMQKNRSRAIKALSHHEAGNPIPLPICTLWLMQLQTYLPALMRSATVSIALVRLGANVETSRSAWGRPLG